MNDFRNLGNGVNDRQLRALLRALPRTKAPIDLEERILQRVSELGLSATQPEDATSWVSALSVHPEVPYEPMIELEEEESRRAGWVGGLLAAAFSAFVVVSGWSVFNSYRSADWLKRVDSPLLTNTYAPAASSSVKKAPVGVQEMEATRPMSDAIAVPAPFSVQETPVEKPAVREAVTGVAPTGRTVAAPASQAAATTRRLPAPTVVNSSKVATVPDASPMAPAVTPSHAIQPNTMPASTTTPQNVEPTRQVQRTTVQHGDPTLTGPQTVPAHPTDVDQPAPSDTQTVGSTGGKLPEQKSSIGPDTEHP